MLVEHRNKIRQSVVCSVLIWPAASIAGVMLDNHNGIERGALLGACFGVFVATEGKMSTWRTIGIVGLFGAIGCLVGLLIDAAVASQFVAAIPMAVVLGMALGLLLGLLHGFLRVLSCPRRPRDCAEAISGP